MLVLSSDFDLNVLLTSCCSGNLEMCYLEDFLLCMLFCVMLEILSLVKLFLFQDSRDS